MARNVPYMMDESVSENIAEAAAFTFSIRQSKKKKKRVGRCITKSIHAIIQIIQQNTQKE